MTELKEDEPFDFETEVIATYRLAKLDVELRIKALMLLAKVQPTKPTVKPGGADGAAQRAQAKMNGKGQA